jgi:hypothetical protein
MFFFMKKHMEWSKFEMEDMSPNEFEIFYFMTVKDFKDDVTPQGGVHT